MKTDFCMGTQMYASSDSPSLRSNLKPWLMSVLCSCQTTTTAQAALFPSLHLAQPNSAWLQPFLRQVAFMQQCKLGHR